MPIDELTQILIKRGEELVAKPAATVEFTRIPEADALVNNLTRYPHAFVLASVMDRQIKAEKAWLVPHLFRNRLGSFEFVDLTKLSLQRVKQVMAEPEPLHRFPDVMAQNFHSAVRRIAEQYSGNASAIWAECPSSATIVRRFLEFDGVGPKIASMAANILVRDFKVPVSDKLSIDISPDIQVQRVFVRLGLIHKKPSREEVIYRARELNPYYPGVFDLPAWEIGRVWCRPTNPRCSVCYMNSTCPRIGLGEAASA